MTQEELQGKLRIVLGVDPDAKPATEVLAAIDLGRTALLACHRRGAKLTEGDAEGGLSGKLGAMDLPIYLDDFAAPGRVLRRDFPLDGIFEAATISQTGAVGVKAVPHYEESRIGLPGRTRIGLIYASDFVGGVGKSAGSDKFHFPHTNAETDSSEQLGENDAPAASSDLTIGWMELGLKRTAAYVEVSASNLANPVFTRAAINSTLLYQHHSRLENQLINGNATGNNWTGLANSASGIPVAAQAQNAWGLDEISDAIAAIEGRNFDPDLIAMSPADFRSLAKVSISATDDPRRPYAADAVDFSAKEIFGLPVVQSGHLAAGTVLILSRSQYYVAHDASPMRFRLSDSEGENFLKDMVVIELSTRAELAILSEQAHRVITGWVAGKKP